MVVGKEFELNDDCTFRIKIPNTEGHGSIYTCSSVQCGT